jgi:hypothetical protein
MRPKPRIRLLDLFVTTAMHSAGWERVFCCIQLFLVVTVWRPSLSDALSVRVCAYRASGAVQLPDVKVVSVDCSAHAPPSSQLSVLHTTPSPPRLPSSGSASGVPARSLSSAPYCIPHTVR